MENQLNKQLFTIKELLCLYEKQAKDFQSFDQAVELLAQLLRNANEDKQTVTKIVQDRDELQHEFDGLCYKMQLILQERDKALQKIALLEDQGRLAKTLKLMEEERDGL